MQNWVTTGKIKVGQAVGLLTHVETVFKNMLHFRPRHFLQMNMVIFRKNIAMLAALVTAVGDVPLKGEIFHFSINCDKIAPGPDMSREGAKYILLITRPTR
jgi:hypothetical protein